MSDPLPRFDAIKSAPRLVWLTDRAGDDAPLPHPLTSFIGREAELVTVTARLREPDVRLLTLTGPAGIGKTRLAIQAANAVAKDFGDGVSFIALGAIVDPQLVLPTIAHQLSVPEVWSRSIGESLHRVLQERHQLLVLDNFEQVLSAAPALIDLLVSCPRLELLVTSRALLRLSAEHAFAVPPLGVPPLENGPRLEELTRSDAVMLFTQRARAAQADFSLSQQNADAVTGICRRLEGVPLAIELAASRVVYLSPTAMMARMNSALPLLTGGPADAPLRQQTMRDAIAWSYDLLSIKEQMLFCRLGVFVDGFTLEAAQAIAGEDDDAMEVVFSLLSKSLLQQQPDTLGEPRYAMLEAVREFALDQLAVSGAEYVSHALHAVYFLQLAEGAAPDIRGAEQQGWLSRLEIERANLRAACLWLIENDIERAVHLAASLVMLWYVHNHLHEGGDLLKRVLAEPAARPAEGRAAALRGAGMMAFARGDYNAAETYLLNSLDMARELNAPRHEALPLQWLALVAEYTGDDILAANRYEAALTLFRDLDDSYWIPATLSNLADTYRRLGDLPRAMALSEEALILARQISDGYLLWNVLGARGSLAQTQQAWDDAIAARAEELAVAEAAGDYRGVADAVAGLGGVAVRRRQLALGVRLLAAADALRVKIGRGKLPSHDLVADAIHVAQELMPESAFAAAWTEGSVLSLNQAIAESYALETGTFVSETLATQEEGSPELTARERDVLVFLIQGYTDKEIAAALEISRRTAAGHVANIVAKLDAVSRTDAAVRAVRLGLI